MTSTLQARRIVSFVRFASYSILSGRSASFSSCMTPSPSCFTGIRFFIVLSPLPQYLSVKNHGP